MNKRMTATVALLGLVVCLFLTLPTTGAACPEKSDEGASRALPEKTLWSLALLWENDSLALTDRFYTNGIGLALTQTGKNWLDPLADRLPWGYGRRTVGYSLSQYMFTPADTTRRIPDPDDRPYAGVLSFDLSLQVEHGDTYHGVKGMIGVIGPSSGAGRMQMEVHRLLDRRQPEGWSTQLKDEPLLNVFYEYRRTFILAGEKGGWDLECLPVVGGSLGNFRTQGLGGGIFRIGYAVPQDFGPGILRGMGTLPPPRRKEGSEPGWGFSIYVGAVINLVLRDITLDGNTFSDSPRVEKYYWVPAGAAGIGIHHRSFRFTFSYVFLGKEFKGQKDISRYGAMSLIIYF